MTQEIAIEALQTLYTDFQSYFDDGKLLVTGSLYYKSLDPSYNADTFNDIDLVVDERPEYDSIVPEIHNFYARQDDNMAGFVDDFGTGTLIGCCGIMRYENGNIYEYVRADIFRNDFSGNVPLREIVPGVYSQGLPESRFIELFEDLTAKSPENAKFAKSLAFFNARNS
jgi:hypothetical protein